MKNRLERHIRTRIRIPLFNPPPYKLLYLIILRVSRKNDHNPINPLLTIDIKKNY